MPKSNKQVNKETEKSSVVAIGWCGAGAGPNTSVADVKNRKCRKIRQIHFDWKQDQKT